MSEGGHFSSRNFIIGSRCVGFREPCLFITLFIVSSASFIILWLMVLVLMPLASNISAVWDPKCTYVTLQD